MKLITSEFQNASAREINRPYGGEIDMLIGIQYAAYHPTCIEARGHLVLSQNRFGHIIAGSHPDIQENTTKLVSHAIVLNTNCKSDQFFELENS